MEADRRFKSGGKGGIFVVLAVLAAACSLTVVGYGGIETARYHVSAGVEDMSSECTHNPDEIIVKFKGPVADVLEEQLSGGRAVGALNLSGSLDNLKRKYKVKKITGLIKNFKAKRRRIEKLHKKDGKLLTKREKHLLRRLKRAPKGAKAPELERIYKIKLGAGQSAAEAVREYNRDPDIEYAELNYIVKITASPNDPLYPIQWPLNNTGQMYPESGRFNEPPGTPDSDIDAPEGWDIYTGSSDIIVAVVDTGVDYIHRDLSRNMWTDANGFYGYDFVNDDKDPMDDHGHGTHCAGIIAAEGDNGYDIAGVSWNAKIMAVKFLNRRGTGNTADAVSAFYYAVENGADVISNSWGGGAYSQLLKDAIDYAHSQGVITVASAGNDDTNTPQYPGYYESVIAVAATDSDDDKASFSNYGEWVDIAAPGVDILSLRADGTSMGTVQEDYTTVASGTSMACPHISGACALLLSVDPALGPNDVSDILTSAADELDDPNICKSGRLNIYEALLEAISATGNVELDADYYACADSVGIRLADCNIANEPNQDVMVETSGGDSETVFLTEIGLDIGVFTGSISTESGDPCAGDGTLQVSHGETVIVTYVDANNDSGSQGEVNDTAEVDCLVPNVTSDVNVTVVGPDVTVTFETDEVTLGRVLFGTACNDLDSNMISWGTEHSIRLVGVSALTDYYFKITATDAAGNQVEDDNGSNCYEFSTDGPSVLNVPGDYNSIQEAIENSSLWAGSIIWVAAGTYYEDVNFGGLPVTLSSSDPNDWDVVAATVIDANGGTHGVEFISGERYTSVLRGFTVRNAYIGVLCFDSSPTIKNCVINGNHVWGIDCGGENGPRIDGCIVSENRGGINCGYGVFERAMTVVVTDCVISNNPWAGILCGIAAISTIENCIVSGNSSDYWPPGGAIRCGWETTIKNCLIEDNATGGVVCGRQTEIVGCTIKDNNSLYESHGGGGIYYGASVYGEHGKLSIRGCRITNNVGWRRGGGVYCEEGSVTISDSTITGNFVKMGRDNYGGGIYCGDDADLAVRNCTVTGNFGDWYGGGICCFVSGACEVSNCVLWGNEASEGPEIYLRGSDAWVSYSDVEGGQDGVYIDPYSVLDWGAGNIDVDPVFVKPGEGYLDDNGTPDDSRDDSYFWVEGDYHLLEGSPCIDAGDPNYIEGPNKTDLDGNPRLLDGDEDGIAIVDMGAYEYWPPIEAEMKLTPQTLNCQSKGRWVKAHFVLAEGYLPEDVDVNSPMAAELVGVESEYIKVFDKGRGRFGVEIGFEREVFCAMEPEGEDGYLDVKVTGWLLTGQRFEGTDTIRIIKRRWRHWHEKRFREKPAKRMIGNQDEPAGGANGEFGREGLYDNL